MGMGQKTLNVGELGKWIAKMAPRGVSDYKPMCVLLQAVLRDMISGKLRHNNEMIVELRDTVHSMQDLLRKIHDQYTETLTAMVRAGRGEGGVSYHVTNSFCPPSRMKLQPDGVYLCDSSTSMRTQVNKSE